MELVHDALADGRPFRVLTVVAQWSRQNPLLEVAPSMSGGTVRQALDRVLTDTRKPQPITVDHGTEFMSRALTDGAFCRGVQLDFTRPWTTTETPSSSCLTDGRRDERLSVHQFLSVDDVRAKIGAWRLACNQRHPHRSLGHLISNEYVEQRKNLMVIDGAVF